MQEMLERKINKPGDWGQVPMKRGGIIQKHHKCVFVPWSKPGVSSSNHKYKFCIRASYLPSEGFKRNVSGAWTRSVNVRQHSPHSYTGSLL